MIEITSEINKVKREDWQAFLASHAQGNFFQSPEYYFALEQLDDWVPKIFFAFENQEVNGVLLAVSQITRQGPLRYFSSKVFIQGGPLVKDDDPELAGLLLNKCLPDLKNRGLYTEIKNLYDLSHFKDILLKNDFRFHDHLNVEIDLTQSSENLWSSLDSKKRNKIRQGEKAGLQFELLENANRIEQSFPVFQEVYERIKLPLPSKAFFKKLANLLGTEFFRVFAAKFQDELVAAMYVFCYKKRFYLWYAGAFRAHYDKKPNDFLHWQVIRWAKDKGFKVFDFGGAGKPGVDYGVRDFKKKFGGKMSHYGRYVHINKPILYHLTKFGFRLLKFLQYINNK